MLDTVVMSGDDVCCSVVFGTLVEPTSCLVQPIGAHCCEVMSVYVDLQHDEISITFTAGPVCLCGVSSPVVILGLFVRLS